MAFLYFPDISNSHDTLHYGKYCLSPVKMKCVFSEVQGSYKNLNPRASYRPFPHYTHSPEEGNEDRKLESQ